MSNTARTPFPDHNIVRIYCTRSENTGKSKEGESYHNDCHQRNSLHAEARTVCWALAKSSTCFNHLVLTPSFASRFSYSHIIDEDPEAQVMGGGLVTCIRSWNYIRLCNSDLFSSMCLLLFKKQLKLCCMQLILYLDLFLHTITS